MSELPEMKPSARAMAKAHELLPLTYAQRTTHNAELQIATALDAFESDGAAAERARIVGMLRAPGDNAIKQVAKALATAAHKHLLAAALWEKWAPDARASLRALADLIDPPQPPQPPATSSGAAAEVIERSGDG